MTATARTRCRICAEALPPPFFDLGLQPLANNLPRTLDEDAALPRYPLALTRCPNCYLVQLTVVVDPKVLFDEYLYVTGVSKSFHAHFEEMALRLAEFFCNDGDLVVDVGSNDSTLLSKYNYTLRKVGVEPAKNVADLAGQIHPEIPVLNTWWDLDAARRIYNEEGYAKVITATNVFGHCDNLHGFLMAVKVLLHPEGALVIEVPSLPIMVRDGTFDLCYHEHLSYWSLAPLRMLVALHDLKIFRVEEVASHGGSYRIYISRRSTDFMRFGLFTPDHTPTMEQLLAFAKRAEATRTQLQEALKRPTGTVVAGYGAPAKATVLANYAGLTAADIAYIVDDSDLKQGRYLPGTGIPIVAPAMLAATPPDVVVVFPWNMSVNIIEKLRGKTKTAIIPMPTVREEPVAGAASPSVDA
jgi:hypothetical protein